MLKLVVARTTQNSIAGPEAAKTEIRPSRYADRESPWHWKIAELAEIEKVGSCWAA